MGMTEDDIIHEAGDYWVCKTTKNWFGRSEPTYSVYKNGITHASPVASFEQSEEGLSLSTAYCDYKAGKGITHMAKMTVRELIEELKKLDQDAKVYTQGGEYKDDYRPVSKCVKFRSWGLEGYEIS